MKRSIASIWLAAALLVLATAAAAASVPAAPATPAAGAGAGGAQSAVNPAAFRLLDSGTCSPPIYSCRACSDEEDLRQLCSVTVCGTVTFVSCDPCKPICVLPPS